MKRANLLAVVLAVVGGYAECQAQAPPQNCNGATAAQAKRIAARNRALHRNRWISQADLPTKVAEASSEMARALTSVQHALQAEDVDSCSWAAMHIVMQNKAEPSEPYVADFRDMGNRYVLTLEKNRVTPLLGAASKAPVADDEIRTKWKLSLMEKGWALQSTAGEHLSGSY